MQMQLKGRTIELPDQIYLDQLVQLDLTKIQSLETLNFENIEEGQEVLKWLLGFFKILGVDERFTLNDLSIMKDEMVPWFKKLFEGFLPSS